MPLLFLVSQRSASKVPTYYHNNTPIFPQRDVNDFVHPVKGVGSYSNYVLNSTTQLLQDAPLSDHTAGTGRHPHNVQMSRWFTGEGQSNIQPLANPGGDPDVRPAYYHFGYLEWHGLPSAAILDGGHDPDRVTDYSRWSNFFYRGLGDQNNPLKTPGHGLRYITDTGVAETFGRTDPYDHQAKSLSGSPLEDPGLNTYETEDTHFGPKQWRGLPSARAL